MGGDGRELAEVEQGLPTDSRFAAAVEAHGVRRRESLDNPDATGNRLHRLNLLRRIAVNPFCTFMASTAGRITRVVAGIVLVALGLLVLRGTAGIIIAIVGLVPLVAGLFDFCVFAPLFGCPLSGPKIRAAA
jgi:hypothetical protein